MLTKYDQLGASSRMRMLQFIPSLQKAGFEVKVSPLFSDAYIKELQNNKRHFIKIFFAYLRRIKEILFLEGSDIIWIEKECLPWVPAWVEKILLPKNTPYIIDFDDAVFHIYDLHQNKFIRYLLGQKHASLVKDAASATVGNEYLLNYFKNYILDKERIILIPTVIDFNRYQTTIDSKSNKRDKVMVGWIGQKSTAYNLKSLEPLFKELASTQNVEFVAIGIDAHSENLSMTSIRWSLVNEVEELSKIDIGIMPLNDGLFEKGKCGYKLIQYMALGIPVIASPVGVNSVLIEQNKNGFLVEGLPQWKEAMEHLINDSLLRKKMGDAGKDMIKQKYCLEVMQPILIQLFKKILHTKN